ncbi:MAG: 5-(carboxyamino)imidazole ribonucleotide synthase [Taibaiella sp.]|nr:5-(carboxyamino)imidazole ribonucleotide synthase [Taibaiella sp.]
MKIGILGGGQLGAMLLRYAIDYGLDVAVLDKDKNAPCARYTASFKVGDPMSYDDVMAFGKELDVVTIEMEAVNTDALKALAEMGKKVYPSPHTIETIQDKYVQKQFMQAHGIPVVSGVLVNNRAELRQYADRLPACLKKCRAGYDGKGVQMLNSVADMETAFDEPSVLEEKIKLEKEISVIVARDAAGNMEVYDPVLMEFDPALNLLDFQVCPAGLNDAAVAEASDLARKVATAMNLTGIMAVEMFIDQAGKIYVNELAPRAHNSGHHTIEAAATSQFEQQARLILGLPPGSAQTTRASVMLNLIEPAAQHKAAYTHALKEMVRAGDVHMHWYGKQGGKPGRKMGHITVTDARREDAIARSLIIKKALNEH